MDDYIDNPPLIEKLNEEKQFALVDVADLRKKLEVSRQKIQALELDNQALRQRLNEVARQAMHMFVLSFLAVVLLGLGVNVATTKPGEWLGWALIVSGGLVECVAFMLKPGKGND
ncbi:MAG: hypothetical protein KF815_10810 [Rhodospirillales bacterium]|nr:hypothetical protein [Rhodospirillales bacterium]